MRMALTALNLIKSQTALLKVRKDCSTAPCDSGDTLVESSWQWGLWSVSHQAKTTCRGAAVGAGWVWLGQRPRSLTCSQAAAANLFICRITRGGPAGHPGITSEGLPESSQGGPVEDAREVS